MHAHPTPIRLVTLMLLAATCLPACSDDRSDHAIVPAPMELVAGSGTFTATGTVVVHVENPADAELAALGDLLGEILAMQTGVRAVPTTTSGDAIGGIALVLDAAASGERDEAYALTVTPRRVEVRAPSHAGLFYGIQTLRQLVDAPNDGTFTVPAVAIRDAPRFPYRGVHLDVGRHFFPVDFIKRYIDLMATYKFNAFHWHLTEDQGWRLEIRRYPRLTEIASCRAETVVGWNFDPYVGDGVEYCGFYTQEEAREIVAYAAARYVTVIPEIEMPGHSVAALAAYPALACTAGPFEVATVWGIHEDIYCPKEETFAFLENVLTEVMDIFPSRYIHIGGDEAPKTRWEESAIAQEVMRREGLADEEELQSYFIRRIERFLLEHGRRLIGWDEILEGGLAPEATVMSWRGMEGGIEAARQGHDVIMTPLVYTYFNLPQDSSAEVPEARFGYIPIEKVYGFEPVPDALTDAEARHVLGAQANLWTEFIQTGAYAEFLLFPRLLALAEVVWSPASARDWPDFRRRLPRQLRLLDVLGVNYHPLEE